MVKRIVVLFFLVLLFPRVLLAAEYEIKKGEIVSQIVLKLTGSANYLRDGIKVVTDRGVVISGVKSRLKFDHVRPNWTVVVDDSLAKTVQVKGSAQKTLAQVCSELVGPRCVQKLSALNGISKQQLAKPLADDVYALPEMITAVVPVPVVATLTDLCLNIEGVQESVPAGKVADRNGNCTDPPPPPPPPPPLPLFWLIFLVLILALGIVAWLIYNRRQKKLQDNADQSLLSAGADVVDTSPPPDQERPTIIRRRFANRYRERNKDSQDRKAQQARAAEKHLRERRYYDDFKPQFGKLREIEGHKFEVIKRNGLGEGFEIGVKGRNCRFPNLEDQHDGTVRELDRLGKILADKHPHYSIGEPRMEDGMLWIPISYTEAIGDKSLSEV